MSEFTDKNFPPALEVLEPQADAVYNTGESIPFEVLVDDPTHQAIDLNVRWDSDVDGLILEATPDSEGQLAQRYSELSPGLHTLLASVQDRDGLYVNKSLQIFVNTKPPAPSLQIFPEAPDALDALNLSLTIFEDEDGDELSPSITWYQNGIHIDALDNESIVPAELTVKDDIWLVQVTMSDGIGDSDSAEHSIQIGNSLPDLSATIVGDGEPFNDSTLTCVPTATDIDNDDIAYAFQWRLLSSGIEEDIDESSDTLILSPAVVDPGDRVFCEVIANDGISENSASTYVDVLNRLPELTDIILLPGTSASAGTELTCTATAQDADLDDLDISYQWRNNGNAIAIEPHFVLAESQGNKGETLTCTVTAVDPQGGTAQIESSLVIVNSAPELQSIGITPTNPRSNDTLSCNTLATDPDGDDVTVDYAWTVNGVLQTETTQTFEAPAVGDVVNCSATVSDSDEAVGNTLNANVTILNTAPSVDALDLPTTPIYTHNTITANTVVSDIDGDTLSTSYDWYVDGILVHTSPSPILNGTDFFDKNQQIQVFASTSDGTLSSPVVASNIITIANSLPSAPDVSLGDIYTDDDENLYCEITTPSTDIDGDTLQYEFSWFINGVEWTGTPDTLTYTGDSIHTSLVSSGDDWTCSAVVSDGEAQVPSNSSETSIITCPLQYEYDMVTDFAHLDDLPECWSTGYSTTEPTAPVLQTFWTHEVVDDFEWLGLTSFDIRDHITGMLVTPEGVTHQPYEFLLSQNITQAFYLYHNPNVFKFHSGANYIYLRWTAPITTECSFDFTLLPVSRFYQPFFTHYVDTTITLYQNHTPLYDIEMYGYNNNLVSFNESIAVEAGDVFDFVMPPTQGSTYLDWVEMLGAITCDF